VNLRHSCIGVTTQFQSLNILCSDADGRLLIMLGILYGASLTVAISCFLLSNLLATNSILSPREAKAEVLRIFRKVGISEPERRYNCYPHELSGGLRQRVMIAMAMICRPKLVIADEPTTALDVTVEAQILQLMRALRDETGSGIVIISHNLGVIAQLCDYVYVMYAGRVVEQADTFDLFARPMHPYTAGLMAAVSSLARGNGALEIIPGTVPNLLHLPVGCSFSPRCAKCGTHCGDVVPELREVSSGHLVRCINIPEVRL
jgi:peptide/nickel transport system ATP-binding protein